MLAALRCPTCSAPLTPADPHARTLACPYCGASVLLAERAGGVEAVAAQERHRDAIAEVIGHLRAGRKIEAIKVYRERFGGGLKEAKEAVERIEAGQPAGAVPATTRGGVGCVLAVVLVVVFVAALLGLLVFRQASPPGEGARSLPLAPPPTEQRLPGAEAEPPGPPAFAEPVLRFGSEGVGAGRFTDARSVAVDGDGRIYVAEYQGGRVQVFDAAGAFRTQWTADPEMPLVDLAADRGGTVYVVQSGRIRRFEGATGAPLADLPRPNLSDRYSDVTPALDGSLYAVAGRGAVVHLSPEGRVLRRVDLHEAVGPRVWAERVAVSGTGDLYVLDRMSAEVYRLDRDGRFVDRFGGRGDGPDHLGNPADLAVDGRGRVFVSDLGDGVRVFDATGHFLGAVAEGTVVFGLAFTDRDELFAAHRNAHEVVKYRLTR